MSGDFLQLNIVGVQGKKTPVVIDKNKKMVDLFQQTSSKCGLDVPPEEIRLIYQGEELDCNSDKSIKDYGLQNNGHVYMVVRVKGGN